MGWQTEPILQGWEFHLTFDVPVDTVESTMATVKLIFGKNITSFMTFFPQVSGSGTEWKLHSKSFNEDFPEGQVGGEK